MSYSCPDCGDRMLRSGVGRAFDGSMEDLFRCVNYKCPACKYNKHWGESDLDAIARMRRHTQNTASRASYGSAPRYQWQSYHWQPIQEDKNEMKEVQVTYKHNGTIVEILFITIKRRGWFEENVKPVVDVMKAMIPATMRSYDPITYKWEVAFEYWAPLEVTLKSMNFKVTVVEDLKYNEPKVHVPEEYAENFYRAPTVTKELPSSVREQLFQLLEIGHGDPGEPDPINLKSLYRNKARQLHPDLGGDAAKMSELNRLWSLYNAS